MIDPTSELKALVDILVEWAAPAPKWKIYLFGSRVRGDHQQNSDVDIAVDWGDLVDADEAMEWWGQNNSTLFEGINAKLPGPLQILEHNDTVWQEQVKSGPIVYQIANIYCVSLPPKPAGADG